METGDYQTAIVSASGYLTVEKRFVAGTDKEISVYLARDEDISYEITVKSGDLL